MVRSRRGAGSLGCLFTLLIIAVVVYFSLPVAEAYFRYYRFEDEMKQAVRFARINPDAQIKRRLEMFADTVGLPDQARNIVVHRRDGRIAVSSIYTEQFHFPGYVKLQTFTPRAEGVY